MNRHTMEKLLNATFECDHSNQKMTHYSNLTWEQTCEECGEIIKSGTYEKGERGQILDTPPQQRKPLTDGQLAKLGIHTWSDKANARAIEAAHGIKGEA